MEAKDKTQFEALMALADFRRQQREARIGREWQVTLPLWGLLAGLAAKPELLPNAVASATVALLVVSLHATWLTWHWLEARRDRDLMDVLHDKAYRIATDDEPPFASPCERPPATALMAWSHFHTWMKFASSALLGLAVILSALAASEHQGLVVNLSISS